MNRFAKHQLILIAAVAAAGLILSGLWLYTGQKSWKGVMLERKVNLGDTVSEQTLISVWDQIQHLDQTLLPGAHVHIPGLAARLIILDDGIPIEKRAQVLIDGEAAIINALCREPASAAAWARLAWLRHLQDGPSKEVLAALRMSIYMAPAKRSLVFWRIRMAGLNRVHWDAGFENLIQRQVIYASRISQRQLESLLKEMQMEDLGQGILPQTL